ncbi:cell division protein FtsQ/DivIB [Pseudooceanicola sp.]|uniref:cell division protein FtsQ/DivIB n=1 Tax=Pseudooceanicola sp. TaxID=1914328 RepID=UPI002616C921|nr:cell division protein FtsQ/DivIB [Pseudooceanicola sp.]MDF1854379.1 cell division protein FtsQ/DivIB [Pseudooceanicola sp.]
MRKVTNRADPAPSRWAFRLQRIMLTPTYRLAVRAGVPFVISAGLVLGYMSNEARRDNLTMMLVDLRRGFETQPQFMVKMMVVEGASAEVEEDIREVAQVDFPVSSFDLDLEGLRASLAEISAVATSSLRVRTGGMLEIRVSERQPAAIWRSSDGLALIDSTGVAVGGVVARSDRPDLPLIVGAGADVAVSEALEIANAAGPISGRVRGIQRIGQRRWDVVLDRNQRIMLPETDPVQALERVIALHQAQEMLDRDLVAVDMRLSRRPTIRMTEAAVDNWWKIKDIVVETKGE